VTLRPLQGPASRSLVRFGRVPVADLRRFLNGDLGLAALLLLLYLRGRAVHSAGEGWMTTDPLSPSVLKAGTGVPWPTIRHARRGLRRASWIDWAPSSGGPGAPTTYRVREPATRGLALVPLKALPVLSRTGSCIAGLAYCYVSSFSKMQSFASNKTIADKIGLAGTDPGRRIQEAVWRLKDVGLARETERAARRRTVVLMTPKEPVRPTPPNPSAERPLARPPGAGNTSTQRPPLGPSGAPPCRTSPEHHGRGDARPAAQRGLEDPEDGHPAGTGEKGNLLMQILTFPGWVISSGGTRRLLKDLRDAIGRDGDLEYEVGVRLHWASAAEDIRSRPRFLYAMLRNPRYRRRWSEVRRLDEEELRAAARANTCTRCGPLGSSREGFDQARGVPCDCPRGQLRKLLHKQGLGRERRAAEEKAARAAEFQGPSRGGGPVAIGEVLQSVLRIPTVAKGTP